MKKVSALLILLVTSFFLLTILQVTTQYVRAIDSPLTSPITPPLTSFAFMIKGKISIKHISFASWFSRFVPAQDIRVKLQNVKTHDTQTVQTDSNGIYTFLVEDKGWYKVAPQITNAIGDIVAPPLRFVVLNKHDKLHEDFHIIDLP